MAKTAILDVAIDREGNLKKFVDLYEKFKAGAKEAPKGIKDIDDAAKSTAASFGDIVAAMFAQTEMLSDVLAGQEKVDKVTKNTDRTFKSMARSTTEIAKGVAKTTTSLLKWASLTTVFSGLLGAGGLFGLDRLAGNVGASRRSAQGIGTTTGDQQAFGINYGRYVDPQGLLGNVANAKSDLSRLWAFSAAGVNPNGKDPTAIAVELINKAKSIFDKSGGSDQEAQSHGLLEFFTMDELRRLHATTVKELNASGASYGRDRGLFARSDETSRTWQDFSIQMSRAGTQIENVFVRGLVPLIPGLTKLSAAFASGLGNFMDRLAKGGAIEKIGDGLSNFASYVGSDDFQSKVKTFATDVVALGGAIHTALEKLGIVGPKQTAAARVASTFEKNAPSIWDESRRRRDNRDAFLSQFSASGRKAYAFAEKVLPGVAWQESHNNPKAIGPMTRYGTAKGMYQLLDSVSKAHGVDPFDPAQARVAARDEIVQLFRKYGGDQDKVLAGYNWGQRNVDKSVAKYGKDWLLHAPRETRDYVIKVENNTGGSAVVTGNQIK